MTSVHGYDTPYSNIADNNVLEPMSFFKTWIIPEGLEDPGLLKKYMEKTNKQTLNSAKEAISEFKTMKNSKFPQGSSILDYIKNREEFSIFYGLLKKFPVLLSQLQEYTGAVFLFKNSGAVTITPNRYDQFQIENMMRLHISKTILYFDQLKDRKLRVNTLLDNNTLIVYNKPIKSVVSQKDYVYCTKLIPNPDINNPVWVEEKPVINQGSINVLFDQISDSSYIKDSISTQTSSISRIVECTNGIIYVIDKPIHIDYYQF